MDPLPVELWTQVLQKLTTQDWLTLCTTCRLMHSLARVHLYKAVSLSRAPHLSDDAPSNQKLYLFARSLTDRPELSHLVRTLRLISMRVQRPLLFDTFRSHPILAQLPSFSGLGTLELMGFLLDAECHVAIHSLPHLKRVEMTFCATNSTLSKPFIPPISSTSISEASISYPKSADGWATIVPGGIQSLTIEEDRSLLTDLLLALPNFISPAATGSLTTLVWKGYVPAQLIHLLEISHQIRSLSLLHGDIFKYSDHVQKLSRAAIPQLAHFAGPAEYAEKFVSNRPVHRLELDVYDDTKMQVLEEVKLSKVPVTRMELLFHSDTPEIQKVSLLHVPVTLQFFGWNEQMLQESVDLWLAALRRMTSLHVLKLGKGVFHWSSVVAFSTACPSLREIIFPSNRWCRKIEGRWERFLEVDA